MICLKCKKEYPPEAERCSDCQFQLAGKGINGNLLGPHFMQLVRASEEMAGGLISSELYACVLENMKAIIDTLEADVDREAATEALQQTPDAIKKVVDQPIKYAREGARHFRMALEKLGRFLEQQDLDAMHEGLALAEKGDAYLKLTNEIAEYSARELEAAGKERE